MFALQVISLFVATSSSGPEMLNGGWQGRLHHDIERTTCPSSKCVIDDENSQQSSYFVSGKIVHGHDLDNLQHFPGKNGDIYVFTDHDGQLFGNGYRLSVVNSYFYSSFDEDLAFVWRYQWAVLRPDGSAVESCICAYTADLKRTLSAEAVSTYYDEKLR